MNLEQLLAWRAENRELVQRFLHQHREIAGIHFMCDEDGRAYIEFAIKPWAEAEDIAPEIQISFAGVDWVIAVADPPSEGSQQG